MTAEEIEIIVTAKIEEALKELNKIVPAIKEKMKQVQEAFSKIDTKEIKSKVQQATNFAKKKIQDLKKSSENSKIAIKVNNKEASKQVTQLEKEIDSLQKKITGRQLKLDVTNTALDKIRNDTNQSVIKEMPDAGNKKITQETYSRLDKDINYQALVKQSDKLNNEIEKYNTLLSSAKTKMTQLAQQTSKTATIQNKLSSFFSVFKQKIEQVKTSARKLGTAFKQMPKTGRNITSSLKGMGGSLKAGLGQIFKIAGALFGLQTIYSTLRSAASTWLSSQNSQAKQLSANIDYMKYALGSTLAPVIQYIVNLIYQALKGVQSLIYALTGVNIFANASAKAYSSMAKSAKKASDALRPGDIDEVHNIQESNSGGSGGTGDVMPNIDLGQVDTKLNDFLKKLKEGKWYEAGAEIGKKINESLEKIPWESIKKKAGNIGKGIAEFINGGIKNTNWNLAGSTLGEGINTAITFLKNFITTLDFASIVDAVFDFLISAIATINWGDIAYTIFYLIGVNWGVSFRMLWNVISTSCSSIGKYFSDKISEAGGNVALGLWNGIIEGLGNIASWVYDNVIKPLIDGFKNGMGIHSPSKVMAELGNYTIEGFIQGIKDKVNNLDSTVEEICNSVKNWFKSKLENSKFAQIGRNVIDGIKRGIKNNPVASTISNVCGNVKTWFSNGLGSWNFTSIGENVIGGIKRGINNAKDGLLRTASRIADSVTSTFKNVLGIHSPSKVMADYVGKFIPLGIAEGIKDKAQSVYDSIYEITNGLKLNKQGLITDISATYSKSDVNANLLNKGNILERAMNNISKNSGGTINFENTIKLNSKVLARELIEDLDTEAKRRGYKLLQRG